MARQETGEQDGAIPLPKRGYQAVVRVHRAAGVGYLERRSLANEVVLHIDDDERRTPYPIRRLYLFSCQGTFFRSQSCLELPLCPEREFLSILENTLTC